MKYSSLSSGSSGNSFYILNEKKDEAILIDSGISCKKTEESLSYLKKSPESIKAIFVTHEHSDHIKGADVIARKYGIPIFATPKTIKNSFICSNESLINPISGTREISIAGMDIKPFKKNHDGHEPISYSVFDSKKMSILTDIGKTCKNVEQAISDASSLIMESNHDINMLKKGKYPYLTKQRILSSEGHLSNWNSALSVLEHAHCNLKNITLAHLSQNNNTPELAQNTFKKILNERKNFNPEIEVALRRIPTRLKNV